MSVHKIVSGEDIPMVIVFQNMMGLWLDHAAGGENPSFKGEIMAVFSILNICTLMDKVCFHFGN